MEIKDGAVGPGTEMLVICIVLFNGKRVRVEKQEGLWGGGSRKGMKYEKDISCDNNTQKGEILSPCLHLFCKAGYEIIEFVSHFIRNIDLIS